MPRPSIATRNHSLSVNGANPKIRTNFNVSQNRLSIDGLIKYEGAVTLQRMTGDGLEFDPRLSTSGNWNISNNVSLMVANEAGVIQSPYWFQNLHIRKVPRFKKREQSLNIEFGSALAFHDRETPEGDASQVDPAVGLPRWQVILNLLQRVVPGASLVAAPGSSLPTETIRYPIDKNDRISWVQQAGMVALNSQNGVGFIYQSGPTEFSFFYYADAIATPALTLTHRDIINDPELVQPEEFVSPVERLKVTGVKVNVLDINTTPAVCEATFRPFTLPNGTTVSRKILEVCTDTSVDASGCVFTTHYTKASILPGLLALNLVLSGEDFKVGTDIVTVDTYSPIDGLLTQRSITEQRGFTLIVGGLVTHELKPYNKEITKYFYGADKKLIRTETEYFLPTTFTVSGGLTLYDIFQNPTAPIADPEVFVGTVIEEWKDDPVLGFIHTVSLVQNADGTPNPARPTQEYFITFNPPGRTIGVRDKQQPPEAETKPLPYELRQQNIIRECEVLPVNGAVAAERERTINIRHVHSESQLQKLADWLCGLQWSRALSVEFILPLYDELTTGIPIKRIDYTDENGNTGAYLYEAPQFLISRDSCFIETQMPYLGAVSGPTVTPTVEQQFKLPVIHETIDTFAEWETQSGTFEDYACISTGFAQS